MVDRPKLKPLEWVDANIPGTAKWAFSLVGQYQIKPTYNRFHMWTPNVHYSEYKHFPTLEEAMEAAFEDYKEKIYSTFE